MIIMYSPLIYQQHKQIKTNYMNQVPRTEVIREPVKNKLITITNDVVKLARPAVGMVGQVRIIDRMKREVDLSELEIKADILPVFPIGMEMIVKQCDLHFPVIPVRFTYEGVEYSEIWFYAKDLIYVAGLQGHHLNGGVVNGE